MWSLDALISVRVSVFPVLFLLLLPVLCLILPSFLWILHRDFSWFSLPLILSPSLFFAHLSSLFSSAVLSVLFLSVFSFSIFSPFHCRHSLSLISLYLVLFDFQVENWKCCIALLFCSFFPLCVYSLHLNFLLQFLIMENSSAPLFWTWF